MLVGRRGFIAGLAALVAAPTIVRVSSIMPVKTMPGILASAEPVDIMALLEARMEAAKAILLQGLTVQLYKEMPTLSAHLPSLWT